MRTSSSASGLSDPRTLSRDSWYLARGYGEGVRLFADPRISNRGSLLGKRGSVRVGSAQLFSPSDSPLSFPDWGIRLRGIVGSQI
jgi:hypothetical protein